MNQKEASKNNRNHNALSVLISEGTDLERISIALTMTLSIIKTFNGSIEEKSLLKWCSAKKINKIAMISPLLPK